MKRVGEGGHVWRGRRCLTLSDFCKAECSVSVYMSFREAKDPRNLFACSRFPLCGCLERCHFYPFPTSKTGTRLLLTTLTCCIRVAPPNEGLLALCERYSRGMTTNQILPWDTCSWNLIGRPGNTDSSLNYHISALQLFYSTGLSLIGYSEATQTVLVSSCVIRVAHFCF